MTPEEGLRLQIEGYRRMTGWLAPTALLKGDLARVLAVVRQGTESPEHAAFVARLEANRARS